MRSCWAGTSTLRVCTSLPGVYGRINQVVGGPSNCLVCVSLLGCLVYLVMIRPGERLPERTSTSRARSRASSSAGCLWRWAWLLVAISCWDAAVAPRPSIDRSGRDPAAIRAAPVSVRTTAHREEMVRIFVKWAEKDSTLKVEEIVRSDLPLLSELVRQAGWFAYESNWQLLAFKNMLLGLQEAYPWARQAIAPGWRVVTRWSQLEPSTPHSPLPRRVLNAVLVVAASWGWQHLLLSLFLGFYALLRPSDICGLCRSALSLPDEHDNPQLGLLIKINAPKRRAGAAHIEYTRVDPQWLPPLIVELIRRMPRSAKVWPASQTTLGRRFRLILQQLIPVPATFSLGSLRAGGGDSSLRRAQ